MQVQTRISVARSAVSDLLVLLWLNIKHHALALWGIGLQLDPDYPMISQFMPHLVTDTVLEYRSYPLVAFWSLFLAAWIPEWGIVLLAPLWAMQSIERSAFYGSRLAFWKQAFKESPRKVRVRLEYVQALMVDMERRLKAGESFDDLDETIREAMRIQNEVVRNSGGR